MAAVSIRSLSAMEGVPEPGPVPAGGSAPTAITAKKAINTGLMSIRPWYGKILFHVIKGDFDYRITTTADIRGRDGLIIIPERCCRNDGTVLYCSRGIAHAECVDQAVFHLPHAICVWIEFLEMDLALSAHASPRRRGFLIFQYRVPDNAVDARVFYKDLWGDFVDNDHFRLHDGTGQQ